MVKLPVDPQRVLEVFKASGEAMSAPADLLIAGAPQWLDELWELVAPNEPRPGFAPAAADAVALLRPAADQIVLAVIPAAEEALFKAQRQELHWPAGGLVAVRGGEEPRKGATWYTDKVARIPWAGVTSQSDSQQLLRTLAWTAADRAIPLARRYPGLRTATAQRVIKQVARQTAALGVVSPVPGLDLATVTVAQIRLVLLLGAIYGQEVGKDRALELVSVLGLGFGLRALARRAMGWVPGVGWVIRGGVAYGSTIALGEAAMRYFAAGAPLSTSRLTELARRFKQ